MKIFNLKKNKEFLLKRKTDLSLMYSVKADWVAILISLSLIFIIMMLISSGIYYSVLSESKISAENPEAQKTEKINTEQLERVVSEFNKRKEKFESF